MPSPTISNEAVSKATGKDWKVWFALLDKAGAKRLSHRDIARLIHDKYLGKKSGGINVATSSGWWSQMVAVAYERARGLRAVNQQADGFLVAVHKTVPGSVASLQKKWNAIIKLPIVAKQKLMRVPSKTKRAMLRYKAAQGGVVVSFIDKDKGKAAIIIESIKLPTKSLVGPARKFWKKVLGKYL